jgi:alpha-L-fucosidase
MPVRPLEDIVGWLIQCIGHDGGMLLGVMPRPDGTIDPPQATRLLELGDWLKLNGEAVYNTRGGPYLPGRWGVSTHKGNKVFLFVSKWKDDAIKLPALPAQIQSARLITGGTVTHEENGGNMLIHVPELFHRGKATIVELTLNESALNLPLIEVPEPKNLALGKPVEVSSVWPGREQELNKTNITDGNSDSTWAAEEKARDGWVTVDLQSEREVDGAMLSDAPFNRTQSFNLEAKVGDEWKKLTEGTTIGKELYLDFKPVKARLFRVNIRKTSDTPTLAEFQLFKDEP